VSTDVAASRPRSVRVNVVPPNDVFVEDSGRVVIEAERFASATPRGGQGWTIAKDRTGFAGAGYMVTRPERATVIEPGQFRSSSPELRYTVWIHQPGTYAVYARGMAPDTLRNTIHFGLDNEEVRLADRVGRFPVGRWGWVRDAFEWDVQFQIMDTTLAVLNVVEPGPHVLNVWMHRDGVMLDRIVLVRAPFAEVSAPILDVGSGVGPAQSRRRMAPR
jgi:glycosyl hydrolase family 115